LIPAFKLAFHFSTMSEIEQTAPYLEDSPSESKKPRKRRGILGVPAGKPMLFSFTSKELWPDESSGHDEPDSDEDYSPEDDYYSRSPPPPSKKSKRIEKSIAETISRSSNSSNTELIGSDVLNNDSQESHSVSTPSSSSSSSPSSAKKLPQTKNFDTNGKTASKRKPRTNGKTKASKPKAKVVSSFHLLFQIF